MKKSLLPIMLVFLIAAVVSFVLTGCGAPAPEQDRTANPEYEIIEEESALPDCIRETIEKLKTEKGYFVFDPQEFDTDEDIYLLVSSGEKPTGGYHIALESVRLENSRLEITVSESSPGKDEIVTQALTYPRLLLKLEEAFQKYEVRGTDGTSFKPLEFTPREDK